MATNSPANLRKPLRTHRGVKSKSAYRVIEVSCLDLARLLDWCEHSTMPLQSDGSTIGICEVAWYREAYDTINQDFVRLIGRKGWTR